MRIIAVEKWQLKTITHNCPLPSRAREASLLITERPFINKRAVKEIIDRKEKMSLIYRGAGCSSVDSVPAFEAAVCSDRSFSVDPAAVLGYFPFQPVVYQTGLSKAVVCTVLSMGKVHIKDPLLLIEKSSLCGGSGFPSKKVCQRDHMNDVQ